MLKQAQHEGVLIVKSGKNLNSILRAPD
jgi:hypothetical protein